jgi:hypothetical protein
MFSLTSVVLLFSAVPELQHLHHNVVDACGDGFCRMLTFRGSAQALGGQMKEEIMAQINSMAGEGLRTIGIAFCRVTVSPCPSVPIESSSIPSPCPKVETSVEPRGGRDELGTAGGMIFRARA